MPRLAIPAGSSADLTITVTDNNDAAMDVSEALGIVILLYDKNDVVWGRFSQEAIAGYDGIDITNAVTGVLAIKINEQQTILSAIGKIYMDIKVTFLDLNGSDNDANIILAKYDLGDILNSKVKTVNTHPPVS